VNKLYRNKSIEIPYVDFERGYNGAVRSNETMGSWLSDHLGINIDVISAAEQFLNQVAQIIHNLGVAIANINWQQLANNIGMIASVVANVLLQATPMYYLYNGLSSNPLTSHAFRELDKLTGGLITDVANIQTLPLRVVRGDPITKDECIRDGLLGLKVAAIILSGGSTASIISQSSSQLSRGTLGQTALGRAVLSIGGAVAGAALTSVPPGSISSAVASTSPSVGQVAVSATETVAIGAATGQIIKNTQIGAIGAALIGAGGAVGTAAITGADIGSSLQSYGTGTAIAAGAKVVPGGSLVSGAIVNQALQSGIASDSGSGSGQSLSDMLSNVPGQIVTAISNAPGAIAQAVENLPSTIANAISNIQISAPTISAPTMSASVPNIGQFPPMLSTLGKLTNVISRRTVKTGNQTHYVYNLVDGSNITVAQSNPAPYILAGLLLFAFVTPERRQA
jgi:hypothetical protein